jgi:6-phosphogluconolactonase (cycloisomerase 2 family)
MKLMKYGKTLLMSVLSAGILLSVTSCVESYTVGYLYVTGTLTADPGGSGYLAGFKIEHNTGKLTSVNGLQPPIASGGANPVRAVMLPTGRFVFVLNRGVNKNGNGDCITAAPCAGNVTVFAVGAKGILTAQETFPTEGSNPFRLMLDGSGTHLYVLEHDAPDNFVTESNVDNGCYQALNGSTTTCGDITAFTINTSTGHLSLMENQQVMVDGTQPLAYFPVPANPVDFTLNGSYILTLFSTTAQTSYPYTGGSNVFPYSYSAATGWLTGTGTGYPWDVLTDSNLPPSIPSANAIVSNGSNIYILDNAPIYKSGVLASQSQILPYSVGVNGALDALSSGNIADDANLANPIVLTTNSTGKWLYVANQGNQAQIVAQSGISGYDIQNPFTLSEQGNSPFPTGAGPQCLVEDPSNQFFYTANFNDSTVTGLVLDQNTGSLSPLTNSSAKVPSSYALSGPATWCLVDGHTS